MPPNNAGDEVHSDQLVQLLELTSMSMSLLPTPLHGSRMLDWDMKNKLAQRVAIGHDVTCTLKRDVGIEFHSRRGCGSMDARAL